jgi:hypothetical protein
MHNSMHGARRHRAPTRTQGHRRTHHNTVGAHAVVLVLHGLVLLSQLVLCRLDLVVLAVALATQTETLWPFLACSGVQPALLQYARLVLCKLRACIRAEHRNRGVA